MVALHGSPKLFIYLKLSEHLNVCSNLFSYKIIFPNIHMHFCSLFYVENENFNFFIPDQTICVKLATHIERLSQKDLPCHGPNTTILLIIK